MGNQDQQKENPLVSIFHLPADVIRGETIVTLIGKNRLKLENYRNILVYTDVEIRIQAKRYKVHVSGEKLQIRYYDKDEMEICGLIDSVTFE